MPTEVVTPLIALIGVIISTLISYVVSTRQSKSELQKLRTEINREFGGRLFAKRLEVYPELYALLSGFIKIIQFDHISKAAVNDFVSRWQEWDTRNAILFGSRTGNLSYDLRRKFIDLAKKPDQELERELWPEQSLKLLRNEITLLELALKDELGIFEFETPNPLEKRKHRKQYNDELSSKPSNQYPSEPIGIWKRLVRRLRRTAN
ncbi:MAG: hypothetical protein IT322_16115 [Anaerolineae bacterium]|nr:hypothetical protein [Anaerolineae bacterium]